MIKKYTVAEDNLELKDSFKKELEAGLRSAREEPLVEIENVLESDDDYTIIKKREKNAKFISEEEFFKK